MSVPTESGRTVIGEFVGEFGFYTGSGGYFDFVWIERTWCYIFNLLTVIRELSMVVCATALTSSARRHGV